MDLEPDVGVSFIYHYFFPSAKFSLPGGSPLEVSNQFEFGIDVGSPSQSRCGSSKSKNRGSASATASGTACQA